MGDNQASEVGCVVVKLRGSSSIHPTGTHGYKDLLLAVSVLASVRPVGTSRPQDFVQLPTFPFLFFFIIKRTPPYSLSFSI